MKKSKQKTQPSKPAYYANIEVLSLIKNMQKILLSLAQEQLIFSANAPEWVFSKKILWPL